MTRANSTAGNPEWDRHSISAEIRRRGSNLTKIALDAGEPECTARVALIRCYRKGERLIADFLNVDPSELWPERYDSAPTGRDSNARLAAHQSQKVTATADERSVA